MKTKINAQKIHMLITTKLNDLCDFMVTSENVTDS